MSSEIEDRRQRAREAAQDAHGDPQFYRIESGASAEAAIEVATQVKITDEMTSRVPATRSDAYDLLCDIFAAAGFEVIE